MTFATGSLVRARGREWVVLPGSRHDLLMVRPLGGTDDETTLDLHNYEEERRSGFLWAKEKFAQRKGEKPAVEAEDAEKTHEADPALLKEAFERELVKRGEYGFKTITGGE